MIFFFTGVHWISSCFMECFKTWFSPLVFTSYAC